MYDTDGAWICGAMVMLFVGPDPFGGRSEEPIAPLLLALKVSFR